MLWCECGRARAGVWLSVCEFVSVGVGLHFWDPSPWKGTDRRIQGSLGSRSSRIDVLPVK